MVTVFGKKKKAKAEAEAIEETSVEEVSEEAEEKHSEENSEIEHNEEASKPKKGLLSRLMSFIFGDPSEDNERVRWERESTCDTHDLGFELMREDGICRIAEGVYGTCIQFEDVNYQGARRPIQEEIHTNLVELINSFDVESGFQWFISTRRISKAEFSKDMHYEDVPGEDTFNELRHEQNMILENKISESSYNVRRELYLVLRCETTNMNKAKDVLGRMLNEVEQQFSNIGSDYRVLDGREWLEVINHITNPDDTDGLISYNDLLAMPGTSTIDLIAPPDITKTKTGISYGDYFAKCLYLQKYSNSIRDDFISQIAELPQNTTVSIHVNPIDQADAIELVEGQLLNLKQEKRNYIASHPQTALFDDEMLPGSLGDNLAAANATRDDLLHYNQKFFEISLCVMVYDRDPYALSLAVEEVMKIGRKFTCRFSNLPRQVDGFKSCLPLAHNANLPTRKIMSDALANYVPFTADELIQPGGQYMGQNKLSKNHIFYDRRHAVAPNGFILGKPGRGKSVTAKNQILWALLADPEARVVVLDPEGEYGRLCQMLGGLYLKIDSSSRTFVNPFDITESYSDTEESKADPLEIKTDFIISIIRQMAKNISSLQESIVDRVVGIIYSKYFETHDKNDIPTLQDFYDELVRQPEAEANALAVTIERYITGSMRLFNHKTTDDVDLNNRLVVFDIRDLPKNLKALGLLIVLDQTWNFITSGRSKGAATWFFVDELQLLLNDQGSVDYFDSLYTRSRKWGAIPTGITQNVERLLAIDKTRYMVSNSDFLVILGQSRNDAEALSNLLKLSDSQMANITGAKVAEGLLIADKKIIPYRNEIPKELNGKKTLIYQAVTTKLSDLFEDESDNVA